MRALPLLVVAGLLLAVSNALALHYCTDPADIDVAGQVYVAIDELVGVTGHGDYLWTFWVYMEYNGEPGLQRGGCGGPFSECTVGGGDWCQTTTHPDLLLY